MLGQCFTVLSQSSFSSSEITDEGWDDIALRLDQLTRLIWKVGSRALNEAVHNNSNSTPRNDR
jgi:hypothetical protein